MDVAAIRGAVAPIAVKHGVEKISLFGSRARGDNRPDSDYDFLISKGRVSSLWRLAAFLEDMETALQSPVDILTEGSPDQELLDNARRDAVLVWETSGIK